MWVDPCTMEIHTCACNYVFICRYQYVYAGRNGCAMLVWVSGAWGESLFCFEGKAQIHDMPTALVLPGGLEAGVIRRLHRLLGRGQGQISASKRRLPSGPLWADHDEFQKLQLAKCPTFAKWTWVGSCAVFSDPCQCSVMG